MNGKSIGRAGIRIMVWAALACAPLARAQETGTSPDPYANETKEQRDARMQWWREARFGMFIHWGVYAVPAGQYQGKPVGGIGEWIMHNAKIPCAEYRAFAKDFNPVKYDADAWVRLAKEAGMKYIIITSKHHDGFALFDSKVTDWDVSGATPYKKDLLAPLAKACKKHGLKLGFYYSQAQDWNHPGGAAARGSWDPAQKGDMTEYIRNIAVPQVKELMTQYGPGVPAVLWWDTPVGMNKERADLLLPLLALQPGIIHNNRLGGGYRGDTETPEQHIPATGFPGGRDWETCMTMNDTWGFKRDDQNWKSTESLIRNLVDIASKGGNYLLNVGPTSEGLIPEPSIARLKEIGAWMKVNGESIYDTSASPCQKPAWGRITKREGKAHTTLFLHVFDWPADGVLRVPLANKVEDCYLLADKERKIEAQAGEDGTTVRLAGSAPDAICSVVVLKIAGSPSIAAVRVRPKPDGSFTLGAAAAVIHNPPGSEAQYEAGPGKDCIGFWTNPSAWVEWTIQVDAPGTFSATVLVASEKASAFTVSQADQANPVNLPATGSFGTFQRVEAGTFKVSKAGAVTLTVKPVKEGWNPVNLRAVELKPVTP